MAGPGKQAARNSRQQAAHSSNTNDAASSSSSGKASRSATPSVSSQPSSMADRARLQFDGNRDPNSPRPSTPRSAHSGAPGSPRVGSPRTGRDTGSARSVLDEAGMKNLDVGYGGWTFVRGNQSSTFKLPVRTKPSTLGQATKIGLNTFAVAGVPSADVYQHDVVVGNGLEKKGLIMAVWESKALKAALGNSGKFVFDGNKLAWSTVPLPREIRITVDLDAEKGKVPRPGGKENKHRIMIRQTHTVQFQTMQAYLDRKADFDVHILEGINCMDHVLRSHPSTHLTKIKRNFFQKGEKRFDLGGGVEAFKGAYASIRMVNGAPNNHLSVNVDVANGTFFKSMPLMLLAKEMVNARDASDLVNMFRKGDQSPMYKELKKLRRVHVLARHRCATTKDNEPDNYVIEGFVFRSAKDYTFPKDGKNVSIYDHFLKEYNTRLQYPDLPLIKTTKKAIIPMEVLAVKENQRFPFKTDERQTANMIKFAVTPPAERWKAIEHGLKMLDWQNDPMLKAFGIRINTNRTTVDGRVLPAPKVQFGTGDARPGTSGRWDLKGKKFLTPNTVPLKSWAVCVVTGRRGGKPDKSVIENFVREFVKIYTQHGGRVENKQPAFLLSQGEDVGSWVTKTWNEAGNQAQVRPQILVFILPDKNAVTYGRIKRSAECRYGVVSQCMQYSHVQKCQGQYISNVCMKFNAKLGGSTSRAIGPKSAGPTGLFTTPTMVLGADVSHAAPGAPIASMAALTVSMDKLGIRYAGACETNGYRVEMMSTDAINSMLQPMMKKWISDVGGGAWPKRIMYFRDGVSEGQYQHVLDQEVRDMKALIRTADPKLDIPFVVVIGSKRHHVRFFPESGKGDRNGNPLPGTLVETGVTHPRENDFYFCGHAAIKGTARPAHYHVILNEPNMSNDELFTMINEHGYQYIRATTPISQHPAIYYAHILSGRAGSHDPKWSGSTEGTPTTSAPQTGSHGQSGGSSGQPAVAEKLIPMPNAGGIQTAMWYI